MVGSLHLVITQITFVESFIEDLLSVNLITEGVFTLNQEIFDLNEVFIYVSTMFQPLIMASGVDLSYCVEANLLTPAVLAEHFQHGTSAS